MKKDSMQRGLAILLVFALAVSTSYYLFLWPGRTVETMAHPGRFGTETVVIDAGHGGEDGRELITVFSTVDRKRRSSQDGH